MSGNAGERQVLRYWVIVVIFLLMWPQIVGASEVGDVEELCEGTEQEGEEGHWNDDAIRVIDVVDGSAQAFHIGEGYWVSVLHIAGGQRHATARLREAFGDDEGTEDCELIGTASWRDLAVYRCENTEERGCVDAFAPVDVNDSDNQVVYVSDVVDEVLDPEFPGGRLETPEFRTCQTTMSVLTTRFWPRRGQSGAPVVRVAEDDGTARARLGGIVIGRLQGSVAFEGTQQRRSGRGVVVPARSVRDDLEEVLVHRPRDPQEALQISFRPGLVACEEPEDGGNFIAGDRAEREEEMRASCLDEVIRYLDKDVEPRGQLDISSECRDVAEGLLFSTGVHEQRRGAQQTGDLIESLVQLEKVLFDLYEFWEDLDELSRSNEFDTFEDWISALNALQTRDCSPAYLDERINEELYQLEAVAEHLLGEEVEDLDEDLDPACSCNVEELIEALNEEEEENDSNEDELEETQEDDEPCKETASLLCESIQELSSVLGDGQVGTFRNGTSCSELELEEQELWRSFNEMFRQFENERDEESGDLNAFSDDAQRMIGLSFLDWTGFVDLDETVFENPREARNRWQRHWEQIRCLGEEDGEEDNECPEPGSGVSLEATGLAEQLVKFPRMDGLANRLVQASFRQMMGKLEEKGSLGEVFGELEDGFRQTKESLCAELRQYAGIHARLGIAMVERPSVCEELLEDQRTGSN